MITLVIVYFLRCSLKEEAVMPDQTCSVCEELENSYDARPACPPGKTVGAVFYVCRCGQHWWQSNRHFHLWDRITSEQHQRMLDEIQNPPPEDWDFTPLGHLLGG